MGRTRRITWPITGPRRPAKPAVAGPVDGRVSRPAHGAKVFVYCAPCYSERWNYERFISLRPTGEKCLYLTLQFAWNRACSLFSHDAPRKRVYCFMRLDQQRSFSQRGLFVLGCLPNENVVRRSPVGERPAAIVVRISPLSLAHPEARELNLRQACGRFRWRAAGTRRFVLHFGCLRREPANVAANRPSKAGEAGFERSG